MASLKIQLSIEKIEIDNQLEVAPFPILLSQRIDHHKAHTPFINMEMYMVSHFYREKRGRA
jgi:hypothetical protein